MAGLTLGFGLIGILVGIPILSIILISSRILVNFEIKILSTNILNHITFLIQKFSNELL